MRYELEWLLGPAVLYMDIRRRRESVALQLLPEVLGVIYAVVPRVEIGASDWGTNSRHL